MRHLRVLPGRERATDTHCVRAHVSKQEQQNHEHLMHKQGKAAVLSQPANCCH